MDNPQVGNFGGFGALPLGVGNIFLPRLTLVLFEYLSRVLIKTGR